MDFDDELITTLQTRPDPLKSPSTPATPTAPQQQLHHGIKVGDLFYIRPIPEGLSAPSLEALLSLCHAHTLTHGFDVVKKAGCKPTRTVSGRKSVVPGGAYYKWHIPCVLAGKTKNTRHMTEGDRVRDKRTMKMGCPSRVWAWASDRRDPDGPWEIRYGDIDPALHNHPPVDVKTLPNHRRRAREREGVKDAIARIVREGNGRREGVEKLRRLFPDGLFSDKDFANEMQKYRLQRRKEEEEEEGEEARDRVDGADEGRARAPGGEAQSKSDRQTTVAPGGGFLPDATAFW